MILEGFGSQTAEVAISYIPALDRWAEASSWTLQSSLFVAVAFLCLFNCVVLGFLLFLSTQNATPLSKSKAAGEW